MRKDIKAIATTMAGTIGVGFIALPYSIYEFGAVWGILVLIIVAAVTMIVNVAFSEIITIDKGNKQIPGYAKKYLGSIWGHLSGLVSMIGLFGILVAYGILGGDALEVFAHMADIEISSSFWALVFVGAGLFTLRFGVKIIGAISEYAVIILLMALFVIVVIVIPDISFENVKPLNLPSFSLIFGSSIFAMNSLAAIPSLDEIIGYERKHYKRVLLTAGVLTLIVYLFFGAIVALGMGESLTSEFVDVFGQRGSVESVVVALLAIFGVFSSFILVAGTVKEVMYLDYKIPKTTAMLIISLVLILLLVFEVFEFSGIMSVIGSFSLAFQYLFIIAIWLRIKKKSSLLSKVLVAGSGIVLVGGIIGGV